MVCTRLYFTSILRYLHLTVQILTGFRPPHVGLVHSAPMNQPSPFTIPSPPSMPPGTTLAFSPSPSATLISHHAQRTRGYLAAYNDPPLYRLLYQT